MELKVILQKLVLTDAVSRFPLGMETMELLKKLSEISA
jgi:hypothetical protein